MATDRTHASRQAAYTAKMRAQGFVPLTIFVPEEFIPDIRLMAQAMRLNPTLRPVVLNGPPGPKGGKVYSIKKHSTVRVDYDAPPKPKMPGEARHLPRQQGTP